MTTPNIIVKAHSAVSQISSTTFFRSLAVALFACSVGVSFAQSRDFEANEPFLPSAVRSVSTIPTNGDVNPYGVSFVPRNFLSGAGPLRAGDVLVSNFNNALNLQGTGTTIIRIPATGGPSSVFFQGTSPLGLSTGLATLQYGLVLVANLPTADGTSATAKAGSLLVINNQGKLIQTFTSPQIDGPWDMTVVDNGEKAIAFFSNALNGTVSRIDFAVSEQGLTMLSHYTIASGFMHQGDPAALFDSPT